MWMTDYVRAVKRALRDQHSLVPIANSSEEEPNFDNIPEGTYPVRIKENGGKLDNVRILGDRILCGNFAKPKPRKRPKKKPATNK